jgi:hypothetical protein
MMKSHAKVFLRAAMAAALVLSAFQIAGAGTIIKLSLGDDPAADIEYSAGILSTIDDGDGSSPGDQNTAVEFLDFLSSLANIPSADASYTLTGVTPSALAVHVIPMGTVLQPFTGGTFELWDDLGTLLLGVSLGDSELAGTIGGTATGAVFSTTFGSPLPGAAGGTLAPLIAPGTVTMSISMTDINGGAGLSITPFFSPFPGIELATLHDFEADVTKSIDAERLIPEPSAAILLAIGGLLAIPAARRRA